ncbi:MAG: hypothetical protein OMM_03386 [Candidatus Magnetoglobus multicellularis str. Araruama]|uniref:Uncharacterized protein n=1 Tax=Candidatus Magnetoglobus multicellularis str. Araruama TaxID=890399 RepID=A0A1V1P608_9BACT|nr:MAG: hypothetical protein OMM_03386 [Candidatus Magnetoglobus multicellularis str. Araruama]
MIHSKNINIANMSQMIKDKDIDFDKITELVESILSKEIYWFPVRHHSPAVARYLEMAILSRKPKLILIEGPAEANELIPHVIDNKTKPPIAIYSSYRDDDNTLGLAGIKSPAEDIPPRFASWYPILSYSPEYIALMTAKKVKANTVFIDLPHYSLIKPETAASEKDNIFSEKKMKRY